MTGEILPAPFAFSQEEPGSQSMGCVATSSLCIFLPGKLEALSLVTEALAILFRAATAW